MINIICEEQKRFMKHLVSLDKDLMKIGRKHLYPLCVSKYPKKTMYTVHRDNLSAWESNARVHETRRGTWKGESPRHRRKEYLLENRRRLAVNREIDCEQGIWPKTFWYRHLRQSKTRMIALNNPIILRCIKARCLINHANRNTKRRDKIQTYSKTLSVRWVLTEKVKDQAALSLIGDNFL